ncbi:DUF4397 domain-containing protein [Paenibacillus koleovorans]|uniref:DUF4397 domain-containing protein n=1 Tax=Paenibacillus koleovorans TaxID=121608 RepID=UPI0013E38362|nr:DUF4397 domain-containing protein [Paenibacillus koleovorans]
MRTSWRAGLLMLALALAAAGWSPGAISAEENGAQAGIRFVHASPDGPAVDIFIDGKPVFRGVSFKQATPYQPLAAGSHEVALYPAAAGGVGKPALRTTLVVEEGKKVTAAAVNKMAQLELLMMVDEADASAGKSKMRFIHAAMDVPKLDVAVKGGDVLIRNISYKGISTFVETSRHHLH